jgi:DNA-binding HxlR family transcriptional regulator
LEINPLKLHEKEYTLLILQFLHLNPTGKTFEQICSSIDHNSAPPKVKAQLNTLRELGFLYKKNGKEEFEHLYALTPRGRYASELIWDLFRICLNPHDPDEQDQDFLDFYK